MTLCAREGRGRASIRRKTTLSIDGADFFINGRPTYEHRVYKGMRVEGLLLNCRMVQGLFDDLNPETRSLWDYPDGPWDPERNTREFVAAMPEWRDNGLLGFTINLQGGSPHGYSDGEQQPWINSAFDPAGDLRPEYMARLRLILDRADELGMAPILGLFYFGQDQRLSDENAVLRGCDRTTDWILENGYRNVLIEINNQADVADLGVPHLRYDHDILRPTRVRELIQQVQERSRGGVDNPADRLLVSTSFCGMPTQAVTEVADFFLLHGNNLKGPDEVRRLVDQCRASPEYRGQPIVFNEDDHTDFEAPDNQILAAIGKHASWGFFDYRRKGEDFGEGYQSMPTNWSINTARKRAFFRLVRQITGG
jgi:hypothetical protein